MPLKLEEVRLTPYDASEVIPTGFKVVGEFKTRRGPSPMQYNWYSRPDSVQHEVFHKLATAASTKTDGYTVDELKSSYDNDADKAKVDEIINKFKGSWDHRHTGFDLVTDEATGTHFMLIWRDPRVHYAKEIKLEGDHSAVPHQKTPTYVARVPELIEEAKNPKPVTEKAPRAPKAEGAAATPKAPRASKAKVAEVASAPAGGYLATFDTVPATFAGVEGTSIGAIVRDAVGKFVAPEAVLSDDATVKVSDRLLSVIDQNGLEGPIFVEFVARAQKDGSIKAGFYKICKDLAKKYAESKVPVVPVAMTSTVVETPVAETSAV